MRPLRPLILALTIVGAAAAQPPPGVGFDVPPPGTLSGRVLFVYGMAQDSAGYVWIASEDGLARYDGVAFDFFRADPDRPGALPGNRVTGVAVDDAGAVWASVDRFGLVRVDPATGEVERVPLPAGLREQVHLEGWARGHLWASTRAEPAGLIRIDPARRSLRRLPAAIRWVVPAGDDVLGITDDGAFRYDGDGHWRRVLRGAPVRPVRADRPALLTPDGRVVVLARGALREVGRVPGAAGLEAETLVLGRGDVLWAGGPGRPGLTAFDLATGDRTDYGHDPARPESLPDAGVVSLFQDRGGVLWVATRRGVRTLGPGWSVFRTTPLPPTDFAVMLAAGAEGRVWAGRVGDAPRLLGLDGTLGPPDDRWPGLEAALARVGAFPSDVLEARDGTLWVAGWPEGRRAGLVRVGPDGAVTRYDDGSRALRGLGARHARQLHEDPSGRLWVATEDGLSRHDPVTDSFRTVRADGSPGALAASTIWTLADAPGGRLWVGTYTGGLALFDPGRGRVVEAYRHDPADAGTLSSDVVTLVHPSRSEAGVVWVGTYDGGLNRLEVATGRVERWTRADGLPGLSVKSLLEDPHGRLWVGTDAGLVRLDPATGDVRVYTEADGLPGVNFGLYDAAETADGRFAFAVGNAVVTFAPEAVEAPAFRAAVVLRGLRVDGRTRALPRSGAPIRLGPGERSLGIEAAALAFSAPSRVRYAVRLEGLDAGWVDLGTGRSYSWAGLGPGRYGLRVRAGTASGAWSPHVLTVPVVVEPLWWERAGVRVGGALLLLGLFGLGIREGSQRRLRERVRTLETERRVHDERQRISRDLHDHVGSQLSSLLAGVELARLARRAGGDGAPEDPLEAIEADARETIRQLRETIWALHDEALTAGAFCQRLEAFARSRVRGRAEAVEVRCEAPPDATLPPVVALGLYRIAQEAVTNALKHAGASRLTVSLSRTGRGVALEVADDGRFVEPGGGDGLTGYGLRSMRARAERLGGTFGLEADERGTRVRVEAPLEASPA